MTERCHIALGSNLGDREGALRFAIDAATGEPSPYVLMRPGLEALIARAVFYDLVDLAVEDAETHMLGAWSGGMFFPLGPSEDEP